MNTKLTSGPRSQVGVTVSAELTDGPQIRASYMSFDIIVDSFTIKYLSDPNKPGYWRAHSATATGQKVLKPAADGTQRIGKDRGKSMWSSWGEDLLDSENLPPELAALVDELRPAGVVVVYGQAI